MTRINWEEVALILKVASWIVNGMDINKHLGPGIYRECIGYLQIIMIESINKLREECDIRRGENF